MLTRLRSAIAGLSRPRNEEAQRQHDWEQLLAQATSSQERHEIDEVFSRALAR